MKKSDKSCNAENIVMIINKNLQMNEISALNGP